MANLINATVYQIDGNPQSVATVVAFDTDKIRLQETTLSTIPAVNTFIEVQGEKLNAPVVKYFVSESVATLVAAANTGGVTLLQATIVAINDNPFKTSLQVAFPANKVTVWAFSNGTIQSFLQFNEDKFYATESKSTLVAAANVSSGGALIQNAQVSISSAEILQLNTTPKTIVPPQGSNTIIVLMSCVVRYNYGTIAYSNNNNFRLKLGNWDSLANITNLTLGTSSQFVFCAPITNNKIDTTTTAETNQPLVAYVPTGNPILGDGTIDVFVTYNVITI